MAYGWDPTPAEKECREHGKPVADGIDLLVAQAALSFELWLNAPAPVAVMEQAARNSSRPL
jgi:shikimate 5-dehydrogenase